MTKPLIESLLPRLGINERQIPLEPPYPCPVHDRHTAFLYPIIGGDMHMYFRCTHANCRFVGTIVDLISVAREIGAREALDLFKPGAEFHDLLYSDQDQNVLATRMRSIIDQNELRAYVSKCRRDLRRDGQNIIQPLQTKGINSRYLLDTSCGMVDPKIPPALSMRQDLAYIKNDVLLLPYYSRTDLTHVATYDPNTEEYSIFPVRHGARGIFLEREMSWPAVKSALVCRKELDALRVMSKAASVSTTPVNAITVTSYEALLDLPDLNKVYLLDHQEDHLPLAEALKCWRTIAHTGSSLEVVSLPEQLLKTDAASLLKYTKISVGIWSWVVEQLKSIFAEGRDALTYQLTSTALNDVDREFLLKEMKSRSDIDPGLVDAVEYIRCGVTDRLIDEYVVRRDSTGYHLVSPSCQQLTNFTLHTSRFVQLPNGTVEAHCRMQVDGNMLSQDIVIPSRLLENNSRRLKHTLWRLAGEHDEQLPTALHAVNLPGFDWMDLLHAFDSANFYQGIKQLGVNRDRIDFPNFYIDTKKFSVEPQHNTLFVLDEVRRIYASVDNSSEHLDYYAQLLEITHPSAAGIIGALGHIVHHLVARTARGLEFRPKHFVFPSSSFDGSLWETSFRQLCSIFSRGMMGIELVPGNSFKQQIDNYKTLGDLPLFCRARGRNTYIENWMMCADTPLIMLADPHASRAFGRLHNTSSTLYDLHAFEESEPHRIEERILARLRGSWPYLVASVLKRFSPQEEELDAMVPARIGYTWMAELLGVKPRQEILSMFEYYPPADWTDSVEVFFVTLHKLIDDRSNPIALRTSESVARDPNAVGWTDKDYVYLLRQKSVDRVNEVLEDPINVDILAQQLEERGIGELTATIRRCHVFKIPLAGWEKRAVHRIRELRSEAPVPALKFA